MRKKNRRLANFPAFVLAASCMSSLLLAPATDVMASDHYLQAIDSIVANSAIQSAFDTIEAMNEINVQRLIELTEIPAPPFAEQARAAEFAKRIKAAGLAQVQIDEVGNVIARRAGENSTQTIAIVAHLDTVFPPETQIKVRREGQRFYAPGIGDNTRALVALISLIETLESHDIKTRDDILFIGSVGEEGLGDLRGVRHLLGDTGIKIDKFIAMDGGSIDRLVVDAVGSNRYRIEFSGPGGHSYGAFGRAHPHQALADAISRFTRSAGKITRRGAKATFSVGRIGGGTSINSIPFKSWMEVDMRSTDPKKIATLDKALRKAIQRALDAENKRHSEGEALTVSITSVGERPAGPGDRNDTLVTNAVQALRVLGVTAKLTASSTDSNIPISQGIPAITVSRGGVSKNAHSPDEYWENVNSHLAIQAALLLLAAEAGIKVSATN